MLDEELMACWVRVEAEEESWSDRLGPRKRRSRVSHVNTDTTTTPRPSYAGQPTLIDCPKCGDPFWPLLSIRCYSQSNSEQGDATPSMVVLWEERVTQLSPFEVRTHMESHWEVTGIRAIDCSWLLAQQPG